MGQLWGSRWLLEHRPEWFAGVGAVLNEGGDAEMILRTVRFWGIENVQAGYGLIEFEAARPGAAQGARRRVGEDRHGNRRAPARSRRWVSTCSPITWFIR